MILSTSRIASCVTKPIFIIFLLVGLLLFRFQLDLQIDPDLFARLATGKLIAETGVVPLRDIYSFLPTKNWVDHEWLAGLLFYRVYEFTGERGLYLLKITFALATIIFLFQAQRIVDSEMKAGTQLLWLIVSSIFISLVWHTTLRSQVFTYLFLALELRALAQHQRSRRLLSLLPIALVMPIWANCHGGFVVGLGFLGIHLLCSLGNRYQALSTATLLLFSVCLTAINPYGLEYWVYILSAISMDRKLIHEWSPVSLFSAEGFPLCLVILVLILGRFWQRESNRLEPLLLLSISLYFAFRHLRFVPIPLMIAAVFFTEEFSKVINPLRIPFEFIYGRFISLMLALIFGLGGWIWLGRSLVRSTEFFLDYRHFPVAALEWLSHERPGGKVLSSYRHGNYILWRLFPRFLVAIDGRYEEVYSDSTFEKAVVALDPTQDRHGEALQEISPDFIVVGSREEIRLQTFGTAYVLVYNDQKFTVFERIKGSVESLTTP